MSDWDAVATLVAGIAAVGAAFWTLRDTRRSAWVNAIEKKLAVARRTEVVMEVTRGGIDAVLADSERYSAIIPWNAFAALSGDIGVLDIQQIRLFIFIESLARDAEATANKREDKTPPHEQLAEIRKRCVTLRESCALLVGRLEGQLINYYKSPAFGRLPHPFENPDSGGNPPKEPVQNS
jgi:hypothetical protein